MTDEHPDRRKCGGKERLIHAAHGLSQRCPFDEVTVEEIVKDAGLSRPAFYYHFTGGKEELRAEMIQRGLLAETVEPNTREAMLEAALRVFARSGVSAATMEDIAAEAGISRGALSWHFHSKEDLLRAVVEQVDFTRVRQVAAEIDQEIASGLPLDHLAVFRRLTSAFCDAFMQKSDMARLPILLLYTHPEVANLLTEKILKGRKSIHDYIKKQQEEGVFRKDIDASLFVHILAVSFMMRAVGRNLYDRLPLARLSREEMIEQVVSLLLYGIVKREDADNVGNTGNPAAEA
jgi:TetR/AcrR family transcriptional regulator